MITVGRLCVKIAGRDAGRRAVVVEQLENDYVMIDGETRRKKCNLRHLEPLEQQFEIKSGLDRNGVKDLFKKELGIELKDSKAKEVKPRPKQMPKKKAKPEPKKKAKKKEAKAEPKKEAETQKEEKKE